jgi:hypothetical protein
MTEDNDQYLTRIIRIETRIARIMDVMGLPTRMDTEDLTKSPFATPQPMDKRLARIETRIFKLMEAMSINPRTGKKL